MGFDRAKETGKGHSCQWRASKAWAECGCPTGGCRRDGRGKKRTSRGSHENGGASRDAKKFDFKPGGCEEGHNLNVAVMSRMDRGRGGWRQQVGGRRSQSEPFRGWESMALSGGRGMKRRASSAFQGSHPHPRPGLPRLLARRTYTSTAQAGVRVRGSDDVVWGSQGQRSWGRGSRGWAA